MSEDVYQLPLVSKGTKLDVSGHKGTVTRIAKHGVMCRIEGQKHEFCVPFEQIERAVGQQS